jgi:hypothetical protein
MKKALIVLAVLTPLFFASRVVLAAGDWRQVGQTQAGDTVTVSSVRILKNSLRTAWVRVEYKEPARLSQGGPFVELRARVRFNCASGGAAPSAVWFYSRDKSGRIVVSKKALRDEQFGKESEGGFGDMAAKYVCGQK